MVNTFSHVLLTDGHWRKTLAAVRALGHQGLKVAVGESTWLSMAGFSKYCHHRIVYPSPHFEPSAFVNFLRDYCRKHPVSVLLPMEDETVEILSRYRSDFSPFTDVPVASTALLEKARDKSKTIKLAQDLGIPVPKTWHIRQLAQLKPLQYQLSYPVVIKPRISAGAVGIVYTNSPGNLMPNYLSVHRRFPFPLIQERIPSSGPGYGASFLLDEKAQVKASFIHKRLREYPVSGGASTLRISVRHDQIREMAETLLKSMDWFGVAMVEFKVDPRDGTPKLMEINPRFWGSLSLAVASGVNFPYLLYRMAKGDRFKPVEQYRLGTRCRWLLPGDILHYISNPARHRMQSDFFQFRAANTHYDILSRKDPLPALMKIATPLTFLYDRDMKMRLKKRKT